MYEAIPAINLAIAVSGLTLGLVGLMLSISAINLEQQTRKYFNAFFTVISVYVLMNLLGQLTHPHHTRYWAIIAQILIFLESFFSSLLTVMTTGFLLYESGEEDLYRNRMFHFSVGLWAVYAIMLICTQFTGTFYYFDEFNNYYRGPYYPFLLVPPALIMTLNIVIIREKRDRLTKSKIKAFLSYALIPLLTMVLQMFFYGLYLIVLGTAFAAIRMMFYIINDQAELNYQRKTENSRLKLDILLAQIQPHFLFNSLNTIQQLYTTEPQKADEAMTEFTTYLRHNMDSMTMENSIDFEKELEHARGYLELQKLRFGDELNVDYDLECTDFLIPTLTLQPIVENAVTHGIRKKESGIGTVTIRTRRFPDRVEVSVIDDGPGFDSTKPISDKDRSHIGLKNVKERLARISGGGLVIDSVPGEGTTVRIILKNS